MKADILSRKDQVNTQNDNKDVQLLKEELWNRRTTAEIMMLRRNSRNYDVKKKQHNRENRSIERNAMKWNKRARSDTGTEGRRWTSLRR